MLIALRRAVIATAILVITFLIEPIAQDAIVEANPYWIFKRVDPVLGATTPGITMLSPKNSTAYLPNGVAISFRVSKPYLAGWETALTEINYTLDSHKTQLFSIWHQSVSAIPDFNYNLTLSSLPVGHHSITVETEGNVYRSGPLEIFFMNSFSTTFFAGDTHPSQPIPIPSIVPSTSPNTILASDSLSNNVVLTAALSIVGLFALIMAVIVYKRGKGKASG